MRFKDLKKRFMEKVKGIPEECRPAMYAWLCARTAQELRIAFENRRRQLDDTKDVFWNELPEEFQRAMAVFAEPELLKQLRNLEDRHARNAEKLFSQTRWYNAVILPAAEGVGMGPLLAGEFLWHIGTIGRFPSFGKLVAYAGLHVMPDGTAPSRRRGHKVTWNPKLRTTLFKLTEVWNKMPDCVWRARWDAWKEHYARTRPELLEERSKDGTPCGRGHIHNMARRKIQRQFLRNLYDLWREYEAE